MPVQNQSTNAWTPKSSATPSEQVIIVDPVTTEPILEQPRVAPEKPTDVELLNADHALPDGTPSDAHERRTTPWLIGGLAIFGLVLVGTVMFIADGVEAMFVALTWMIVGYSVAWIVVWAAGLLRARDEKEVEDALCARKNAQTGECEEHRATPPTLT
jgi:hypothetical protein